MNEQTNCKINAKRSQTKEIPFIKTGKFKLICLGIAWGGEWGPERGRRKELKQARESF